MSDLFFDKPILNSPYAYPSRHWELDEQGQPTQQIIEKRRRADFINAAPVRCNGRRKIATATRLNMRSITARSTKRRFAF